MGSPRWGGIPIAQSSRRFALALTLALLIAPISFVGSASAEGNSVAYLSTTVLGTGVPQTLYVYVYDAAWSPVPNAVVDLLCATPACDTWGLGADRLVAYGDGSPGNGEYGVYAFQLFPWSVGEYAAQVTIGSEILTLSFSVAGPNVVITDAWAPAEVMEGEPIYYAVNFYNEGYGQAEQGLSILLDGALVTWEWLSLQPWEFTTREFSLNPASVGEHTLQVVLDSGLQGPLSTVRVLPLPTLRMEDVTSSPVFPTTVALDLSDVRDFARATVQFTYDPALVAVGSVTAGDIPAMGLSVEHNAEAGIVTIRAATALDGVTGNFTLVNIELSAVEHHNTDSTLAFTPLDYRTTYGWANARGGTAHFHGSLLGTTGDDVLELL